jgi:hypothetical protein
MSVLGFGPGVSLEDALKEIRTRTRTEPELGRHLILQLLPFVNKSDNETRAWSIKFIDTIIATSHIPGRSSSNHTRGHCYERGENTIHIR